MARRKAAEWSDLVTRWKHSGKTAEPFGAVAGVDARSLHWWSWALRKREAQQSDLMPSSAPVAAFLPVRVVERAWRHGAGAGVTRWEGKAELRWDESPNGLGKLPSSRNFDGTEVSYAYDQSGRVQDVAWKLDGVEGPFVISRVYDGLGRLQAVRYPDVAGSVGPGSNIRTTRMVTWSRCSTYRPRCRRRPCFGLSKHAIRTTRWSRPGAPG